MEQESRHESRHHESRLDGFDLPSPFLVRTQNTPTSDRDRRPSISTLSLAAPPQLTPDPAYIAPSAASQIVSSELVPRNLDLFPAEDVDEEHATIVSTSALTFINSFLDQLLFSFLASSRSTSVLALRPAISEILKPRLAKEAIDGADEELRGYLSGGDDEELLDFHAGMDLKAGSNVYQIFRRTRLRCMVYTRLGDMEEEDEENYLGGEQSPEMIDDRNRLSRDLGNVSPVAAIFLTSILEFIGEKALIIAGEAAYTRLEKKRVDPKEERLVVEEGDVEKLAFDKTLGRLWRSWKKRVRLSTTLSTASYRPYISSSGKASRATSISADSSFSEDMRRRPSVAEILQENPALGSNTPLTAANLPEETVCESETRLPDTRKVERHRPRSMMEYPRQSDFRVQSPGIRSESQTKPLSLGLEARPSTSRQRSSSLPVKPTPYVSPVTETFTTPNEGPDPLTGEPDGSGDAEKEVPQLIDDSKMVHNFEEDHSAVSTMYDGALFEDPSRVSEEPIPQSRETGILGYPEHPPTDHDIIPQGMEHWRPRTVEDSSSGKEMSRVSTLSSNYSFQGGEMSPLAPSEEDPQDTSHRNEETHRNDFPSRANAMSESPGYGGSFSNLATMQGDRLRTYDESSKAVKRDIPVLYGAPAPLNVSRKPESSNRNLQSNNHVSIPTKAQHNPVEVALALPHLTPLQELMDNGHDSSDESSSLTPSHDARNDALLSNLRAQGSSHQKSASLSSFQAARKPPLATHQAQPIAVNTGLERAAVQRVSPPASQDRAPSFGTRTSISSNRDVRPPTGSSSSNSQVSPKIRGNMGRESNDLARQTTSRSSGTDYNEASSGGHMKVVKSNDREHDFEQLIRSDETIQYTLTPQNMREMEKPESPRWNTQLGSETSTSINSRPGAAPEGDRPSMSTRSIRTLRGLNGLRSNPTNVMDFVSGQDESPSRSPQPLSKSPGGRSNRSVSARDAATKDDSVRDFADFIRSTGPDTDPKVMAKTLSGANATHSRGESSSSRQGPKAASKKITKPNAVITAKKSEGNFVARNNSKLKAREPTVAPSSTTADLADFFRSGPDGMGSDGPNQRPGASPLSGAINGNGRFRDAINSEISITSTQESFAPSKTTRSSTNSRTGLLDAANRGPVRSNSVRPPQKDDSPGPPGGGPVRKQRRVRDPYAIELSDDDDDFGLAQRPEEESLGDFLRNYKPSPSTTTTSITGPTSAQPNQNQKSRKGSSLSMRERLARNIAVIPDYRPLPPKTPKKTSVSPPSSKERRPQPIRKTSNQTPPSQPSPNTVAQRGRTLNPTTTTPNASVPQLPPINPRATSPHLISQNPNSSKIDLYKPTHPTYAAHRDTGRRPKQSLQARDERGAITGSGSGKGSGMTDLAAFLRETEPPAPSVAMLTPAPVKKEEESGWARMFGRRKKVAA